MVPFSEVLEWLERHNWRFFRIDPPYRVFYKHGKATDLPILVEVHDRLVDGRDFDRYKAFVAAQEEKENDEDDSGKDDDAEGDGAPPSD